MTTTRDLFSSTTFHILNRGVDRQDIFWTERDHEQFAIRLGTEATRHSVDVLAFALMSNHFHLVVDITHGDLSSMMRELQGRYALWLNWRLGRTGHLFEARYTSVPIDDDSQLAQTVRYVHRNPISITGSAGITGWRWSSLQTVLGTSDQFGWYSPAPLQKRMKTEQHLEHVLRAQPSDRYPFGWIPPLTPTTVDELLAAVAAESAGASQHLARLSVVALADRWRVATLDEVARLLDVSPKTVSNMRAESRARLVDDPPFQANVNRIVERLG